MKSGYYWVTESKDSEAYPAYVDTLADPAIVLGPNRVTLATREFTFVTMTPPQKQSPLKVIKGDLIKLACSGQFDVIVHGCNCHCVMGAGIAAQIRKEFSGAYIADYDTGRGDLSKLGGYTKGEAFRNGFPITVVNAYTQGEPGRNLDYPALRRCMKAVKSDFSGKRIGMPKIGCGIAGGDWGEVSRIIQDELVGEDVTIVDYEPVTPAA